MADLLSTGQYYIRNDSEGAFAGRNRHEDFSLNPKKVYCPTDVAEPQLWDLQALPNNRYKISARGAPTAERNELLYALLIEDRAEEWIITKAERHSDEHRSLYIIQKADRISGWVARTDLDDTQIAIRPLIAAFTLPPTYPSNQLWNIQALVD